MDSKLRRSILEKYAKDVKSGLYQADDYLPQSSSLYDKALNARDLAEDTLANEVLKQTGVPIPEKGASKAKIENFLQDLVKERYPELPEGEIQVRKMENSMGSYNPVTGIISLDEDTVRRSPLETTSTLLHESAHKYDKDILGKNPDNNLKNKDLRKAFKDSSINVNTDSADLAEKLLKGHHAEIPKLREGSFGLGALKSMLKSGTFKGITPVALAAALSSEDASASDFIPVLDQAESAGNPMDDKMMIAESKANQDYMRSPASADKRGYNRIGEQKSPDIIDDGMEEISKRKRALSDYLKK